MTSCPRENDTSMECQYGCCGVATNQECCNYSLSESTLIIVCVVGGILVVVVVIALIVCITSKNKDRVTRIHPRRRQELHDEVSVPRRRPIVIPKPPPYSELPPQYDTLQTVTTDYPDHAAYPGSTDVSRNELFHSNRRSHRGGQASGSQASTSRHDQSRIDSDAPPSYGSVIRQQSQPRSQGQRSRSPLPTTSTLNHITDQERNLRTVVSLATVRNDRTRQGSPHPSLASGRISTSMMRHNDGLHRTASDRTTYHMFESPGQPSSSVNRRSTVSRGIGSVSPVTIREISVHNEIARERITQQVTVAPKTRIPRPLARKSSEKNAMQTTDSCTSGLQISAETLHSSTNVTSVTDTKTKTNSSKLRSGPQGKQGEPSTSSNIDQRDRAKNTQTRGAPEDIDQWPETPTELSSTAAARSATRRAALQQLHERRKQRTDEQQKC